MKKTAGWKPLVGIALALIGWSRLAEDMPTHDIISPPEPPFKPECKDGEYLSWNASAKRWVCIPRFD
ncbi:MAG TPA: hypothetical protein EYG65_00620 [Rhodospirillales bacterium]|nr:hypothetical protein [Rhodospirillales bacterium]